MATRNDLVYLNNAATSYPKPEAVLRAAGQALAELQLEIGRSGGGTNPLSDCREGLASLLGVRSPEMVVLGPSATYALNTVILGLLRDQPGAHVVTTSLEHNSVLRPLAHLVQAVGTVVTCLAPGAAGRVDASQVRDALRADTKLVCLTHASNVTGSVQPIEDVARVCADRGVPLLVDAAQSAGCVPIHHAAMPGRVFVSVAGHKALLGPAGVGALVVPDDRLPQVIVGGTGVRSDLPLHPAELPLRHEAGTPNLPGIAGVAEGVRFVRTAGVDALGQQRNDHVRLLREGLRSIGGVHLAPLAGDDGRAGVTSFAVDGWPSGELAHVLLNSFGIVTRGGLHCAPRALPLSEFPDGTVRASVGPFSTPDCVQALVGAVRAVAGA